MLILNITDECTVIYVMFLIPCYNTFTISTVYVFLASCLVRITVKNL